MSSSLSSSLCFNIVSSESSVVVDVQATNEANHTPENVPNLKETLVEFMTSLLEKVKADQCSTEEFMCLLQHYAKHRMVTSSISVEEDDWDYISMGILLKQMVKDGFCVF